MGLGVYITIALHGYMFAKNETNFGINLFMFVLFCVLGYFAFKFVGLMYCFGAIFCIVGREMSKQTSTFVSIAITIIVATLMCIPFVI